MGPAERGRRRGCRARRARGCRARRGGAGMGKARCEAGMQAARRLNTRERGGAREARADVEPGEVSFFFLALALQAQNSAFSNLGATFCKPFGWAPAGAGAGAAQEPSQTAPYLSGKIGGVDSWACV